MKRSLLGFAAGLLSIVASAQITYSPFWPTQNSNFPKVSSGTRYMDAISPTVVWAIGYDGTIPNANSNVFTRTTNAGVNFTAGLVWPDTNTYAPASIQGIDANTAWVSAYLKLGGNMGGIFKTTNGGTTWTNMTAVGMFTNTSSFVDFVSFSTPSIGIAVGDPPAADFEIWRTIDGGSTWSAISGVSIPNALIGEYGLTDIYTHLGNHIWFGTNKNRIYHSADDGQTWSVSGVITGTLSSAGITDIAFRDPNNGLALAKSSTGIPYLFSTTNGGATWTQITPIDPNFGLLDMSSMPGTTVYASAGAGTSNQLISYSTDDGVTWNSWGGTNVQYLKVDFVDGTNGWAGGFSDPTTASQLGMFKYSGTSFSGATPPVAIYAMPATLCFGSSLTLTNGSTGTPAPTYSWTATPGVTFTPNNTVANPGVLFPSIGNYTITLAATNSVSVNSTSQVINLTNVTPIVSVVSTSSMLCIGQAATLTANGAFTYSWSTGSTAPSIPITPTINTTYTLLGTNASGCKNTTTFTQTVSACTGIESIAAISREFALYPNPNNGICTVRSAVDMTLNIINELGQVVKTVVLSDSNSHQLILDELQDGIYFICGTTITNVPVRQKMIVTR